MKTIAYVLTDFPVLSETFIGNEIRAMEAREHRVVPFVFRLREGPARGADRRRLFAGPGRHLSRAATEANRVLTP